MEENNNYNIYDPRSIPPPPPPSSSDHYTIYYPTPAKYEQSLEDSVLPPPPPFNVPLVGEINNGYTNEFYYENDETFLLPQQHYYHDNNTSIINDNNHWLSSSSASASQHQPYYYQQLKKQQPYTVPSYIDDEKQIEKEETEKNFKVQQQQQYQNQFYKTSPPSQEFVNQVAARIKEMEVENLRESDHEDNPADATMSMLILLLGIFFFIPLFFSILYLKSKDKYARRFAWVSFILGCIFLTVILLSSFGYINLKDVDFV